MSSLIMQYVDWESYHMRGNIASRNLSSCRPIPLATPAVTTVYLTHRICAWSLFPTICCTYSWTATECRRVNKASSCVDRVEIVCPLKPGQGLKLSDQHNMILSSCSVETSWLTLWLVDTWLNAEFASNAADAKLSCSNKMLVCSACYKLHDLHELS